MPHRMTDLNPEIQEKIVQSIENGNYIETACAANGICTATYYNWLKRGEAGEEPFLSFLSAAKKAEAIAESNALHVIQEASRDSWQAAAWYMERRKPDQWGRKERVEHSGNKSQPIMMKIDYSKLDNNDLKELERIVGRARPERDQEGTG